MSIEICNLRDKKTPMVHDYDIRVDRSSPLGNPFPMKKDGSNRDEVCDKYDRWFEDVVSSWHTGEVVMTHKDQFNFMWRLILLYMEYGKLRLFCWCAPERCHVETIRTFLMGGGMQISAMRDAAREARDKNE